MISLFWFICCFRLFHLRLSSLVLTLGYLVILSCYSWLYSFGYLLSVFSIYLTLLVVLSGLSSFCYLCFISGYLFVGYNFKMTITECYYWLFLVIFYINSMSISKYQFKNMNDKVNLTLYRRN